MKKGYEIRFILVKITLTMDKVYVIVSKSNSFEDLDLLLLCQFSGFKLWYNEKGYLVK